MFQGSDKRRNYPRATIGTTFNFPVQESGESFYRDMSDKAIEFRKTEYRLFVLLEVMAASPTRTIRKGAKTITVPKTIDNDILETDQTGFDTAVNTATEALDKLHTTAESSH